MPLAVLSFLVLALNAGFARAATSTRQFKHWYPQYKHIWSNITKTYCAEEYKKYTTGFKNHSEIDWMAGGGIYTALTQPVIECILENTSEFLKGSTTGAQILLGVMPTIVALLGPSHDEIAMLSNVGRRPLLAAGLALASPSAYFSRAFEYSDPTKILNHDENRLPQWRPSSPWTKTLVSALEYMLTAAACCNVVINTLQVSSWTVSSFASDFDFLPNLWLVLGLCIHIFSGLVLRLRLQGWRFKQPQNKSGDDLSDDQRGGEETKLGFLTSCSMPSMKDVKKSNEKHQKKKEEKRTHNLGASFRRIADSFDEWISDTWPRLAAILARTEFVPCASESYEVHIQTFMETKTFLFLAWSLSTFTVLHVVFGTLVFAGMLFVGIKDALSIVGRYIAAVMVTRVILMYELAGVRECWATLDGKKVTRFDEKDKTKGTQTPNNGGGVSVSTR
ncbi:hypothetical protein MRS44_006838 [Fusarium solani]|uniref:Uncharacterized protein n=1 Tax=Fusarium solani TaxID=169388 RepID=A0A9P9REA8_FUSSL|nr:uncharacterized protein B0J15DRAFT_518689 [Fusarium solani]KAH7274915.1 hypothetical protein B0J15DRAFT_518689 [Fusarium solani]KAJ3466180.1 hypothetical protein MRS44_006838 [Fusarium solani]